MSPKIIDCFIFHNELKMLLFRLTELNDVVDYFVIVESKYSFSGQVKPLFYAENKHMFEQFNFKIIHIVVEDMPNNGNAWNNEFHQRNCITRAYKQLNLENNDLIMISDVDEIPDVTTVQHYKTNEVNHMVLLAMDMYYYNFHCKAINYKWYYCKIIPYHLAIKMTPQQIRCTFRDVDINYQGGWHLSFFGDIEFIKTKIQNFAHQEYNNSTYLNDDKIQQQIDKCDDLFFRDNQSTHNFQRIDIANNTYLPKHYQMLL